jgi:hypothetical protein
MGGSALYFLDVVRIVILYIFVLFSEDCALGINLSEG